jgi:hypothetical protein
MVEFSVMAVTLAKKLVNPLKETHHQTIYFLHGGLHIYDYGHELQKKCWERSGGIPLVDQIRASLNEGRFPLFVSEGSSQGKFERIRHSAYAVLLLDGAGWHQTGEKLRVPGNISLLQLPSYSPELNPVENIWQFLRQDHLGNRVFES